MAEVYSKLPSELVKAPNEVRYAYRDTGDGKPPLVLFQHFRGNLDNWDPALIDALEPAGESSPLTTSAWAAPAEAPRTRSSRWRATPSLS